MWIISEDSMLLTNGNISFFAVTEPIDDNSNNYFVSIKINNGDEYKLAQYSSLDNCAISIEIIYDELIHRNNFRIKNDDEIEEYKNEHNIC